MDARVFEYNLRPADLGRKDLSATRVQQLGQVNDDGKECGPWFNENDVLKGHNMSWIDTFVKVLETIRKAIKTGIELVEQLSNLAPKILNHYRLKPVGFIATESRRRGR